MGCQSGYLVLAFGYSCFHGNPVCTILCQKCTVLYGMHAEKRRIARGGYYMQWMGLTTIRAVIAVVLLCSNALAGIPSPVSGQDIYDTHCGVCHGFTGAPLLPNTPDFSGGERMDKSDSELLDSIRAGNGRVMPAWAGILSDEECEAVLQYIREILT